MISRGILIDNPTASLAQVMQWVADGASVDATRTEEAEEGSHEGGACFIASVNFAEEGNWDVVQYLLDNGLTAGLQQVVSCAANVRRFDIAEQAAMKMQEIGGEAPDWQLLWAKACESSAVDFAKSMWAKRPEVCDLKQGMIAACATSNPADLIRFLVESGADVNTIVNEEGQHNAINVLLQKKHFAAARVLKEKGADATNCGNDGETALTRYGFWFKFDELKTLVEEFGVPVNLKAGAPPHCSALLRAIQEQQAEHVQYLIKAGADVHFNSDEPIAVAASTNNNAGAIRALIAAGAKPSFSVLKRAVQSGQANSLQALIGGGADVNEVGQPEDGAQTLLHLAVKERSAVAAATVLQKAGARRLKNKDGLDALEQYKKSNAQEHWNQDLIAILEKCPT